MGSKRELLEKIEQIIRRELPIRSTILDLFAGTCSVGLYLRDNYAIYSNDIQCYSKTISRGTIETKPLEYIFPNKIFDILDENYRKNYNYVSEKLINLLAKSNAFLEIKRWNRELLDNYLKFIKSLPNPSQIIPMTNKESKWLQEAYLKNATNPKSFPYIQTTFLFSEMYFSLNQAIIIDSLKYAIDNLSPEYVFLKDLLMVSLIHSYSYNSAGTGHFAQFRDLTTVESVQDVFLYRTRSVMDYFLRKAEEIIMSSYLNKFHEKNTSFVLDYKEILSNNTIMNNVNFVYADPPYSFVHYSRFYHAIEDLCKYDYPPVEHKGRYRLDRHQSSFCIKTQAPQAFRTMFELIKEYKIPILVSYSNTGMIKLSEVRVIAEEEGFKTELVEINHKHSTMGRLKDKDRDVVEALLLCR